MADPLSVSASIAGLVTLADIVFRRTYRYVKAVKKAPKEISALSTEIGALYGVLNNLQLVSCQLEHEEADPTTRTHHIDSCRRTLERIESILDRDDSNSLHDDRLEDLRRRLRWPFKSSEVKDMIAEIERHKSTLGLALNVDCMAGLLQALSKHDEIRDTIEGIRTELKERHEAETRIAINKETQEILNSFAKVDPRVNHEMSRKLRSPGTGLWLTEGQEFRQWLDTRNARLWLYGIPGAGKTVLAASVIEETLRTASPSTAVAFFYCDYKDAAKQDLSNILGSLAQQFAKQDDRSFAKLREYYETHNPEHRLDFKYDSETLLDLLSAITLNFDCAMIIVDGLDECGTNTAAVVDAITTLNNGENTTIKMILLSRNEIEIRERLEDYTEVSIAAKSSDLRLYVMAEIDLRTRKKRLRIKDQSLREHIIERLVEGAEGMFRWVACQMDYMCELPNDAARRKALDSLPPDLNSTYERILNRVNQSNPETQKLVRRVLRWITSESDLKIDALCEAISINFGDTKRNPEAISDESEILRWCSSLVRKSADGDRLELAHFTVEEYLKQIDPGRDTSISAYRIDPRADWIILAKVCLTYLNFEDFNQGGPFDQHVVEHRFSEFPLRRYAVRNWPELARDDLDDGELISLVQKLLSPSKPNTFVSWMHDETYLVNFGDEIKSSSHIGYWFADTTVLHWAAMINLAEVCSWLIRSGCDVNRNTRCGTPLHFAQLGSRIFDLSTHGNLMVSLNHLKENRTSDLLLDVGADPNCHYIVGNEKLSPLFVALSGGCWDFVIRLLDKGGVLDDRCLDVVDFKSRLGNRSIDELGESDLDPKGIYKIVERLNSHNVEPAHHERLLQLVLREKSSSAIRFMQRDKNFPLRDIHYEQMLRTAAEIGQVDVVSSLLEDHKLDVDAADEGTGLVALHQAARTDQLEVTQMLIDHGADRSKSDAMGRTALHHSTQGIGARCLELLLHQKVDTGLGDLEGITVWHLAAQEGNVQALKTLLNGPVDSASAIGFKANDGRTPLLCASASQSKESVSLLLSAGSSPTETASDGSSLLHYAVRSGCVEVIKYVAAQAVDTLAVTYDGSNAFHCAIKGTSSNLVEIIDVLLEIGVDPSVPRNDATTPLHDIVEKIRKESPSSDQLDCLFATSRTLLESLLKKPRLESDIKLGSELIYLACSHRFDSELETVAALLELGLDPNTRFDNGRTALMAAAKKGNEAIFNTLLLHGADPCVKDSDLCTALHYACFEDRRNILVRLRDTGIDWDSKGTVTVWGTLHGRVTAFHIAASIENSTVLVYLVDENLISNINARIDDGRTPLYVATQGRAYGNMSLLLSNGADPNSSDENVLYAAARWGDTEAIDEFIRYGSDLGSINGHSLTPELVARKNGHVTLANIIMNHINEKNSEPDGAPHSRKPETTHGASEGLKVAIDLGDSELCMRLVEGGADLESGFGGCMGCTPLLYSFHKDQFAIAKYLISQGASIAGSTCEAWSTRGFSVFHYAAAKRYVGLLRLLLEKFPSEVYLASDPIHPLHYAVLDDNTEGVKLMLDHASQGIGRAPSDQLGTLRDGLKWMVNMQVQGDMLRWSCYGTSEEQFPMNLSTAKPIHIAAYRGYSHIVEMLLAYGAFVDAEDGNFWTPLHHAAANGHRAVVQILLDAGANPNALGSSLYSPCMSAAHNRNVDSIPVLMKGGADIQLRSRWGETALHIAATNGAKDVFVLLMTRSELCVEDVVGGSVLYKAIRDTSAFPMTLITNLGPPSESYEHGRWSVLNAAIEYRSIADVKMLLPRVPTNLLSRFLNHRAMDGTPLYVTTMLSKVDMITLLLDAGAQLELEGSEHGTPLMAACAIGRLAAVKVLIMRGARTSYVKDRQVYSVLTAAKYHSQIRRWLLVGRFLEGPKMLMDKEAE